MIALHCLQTPRAILQNIFSDNRCYNNNNNNNNNNNSNNNSFIYFRIKNSKYFTAI